MQSKPISSSKTWVLFITALKGVAHLQRYLQNYCFLTISYLLYNALQINVKLIPTERSLYSSRSFVRNYTRKRLNSNYRVIIMTRAKDLKECFCNVLNSGLNIRVNKHRCLSFAFTLIVSI